MLTENIIVLLCNSVALAIKKLIESIQISIQTAKLWHSIFVWSQSFQTMSVRSGSQPYYTLRYKCCLTHNYDMKCSFLQIYYFSLYFCFFYFYIYINLNLSIWKYCISLILRPNYLSLSLVYQYISFKPLKTDGMLTDLVRGVALTGGLNTRFLNTNNANLTNIFAHGFLSFNRSRISFFYTHTDLYLLIAHGSHGSCSRRGAHYRVEHEIFLNTNNPNLTNNFCTRISIF